MSLVLIVALIVAALTVVGYQLRAVARYGCVLYPKAENCGDPLAVASALCPPGWAPYVWPMVPFGPGTTPFGSGQPGPTVPRPRSPTHHTQV